MRKKWDKAYKYLMPYLEHEKCLIYVNAISILLFLFTMSVLLARHDAKHFANTSRFVLAISLEGLHFPETNLRLTNGFRPNSLHPRAHVL